MLEINNLSFGYIKKPFCIKDFSLKINDGDKVLLLGGEGMGKTSLLKVLCGLEKQYAGSIKLNNKELYDTLFYERSFSYLPSEPVLLNKSLYKNLEYLFKIENIKMSKEEILNVFNKFDFNFSLETKIKKLSLENKRIFAIIRAYIKNPDTVFIDDQFEFLDDKNIIKIKNAIDLLINENNDKKTLIMVLNKDYGYNFNLFDNVLYLSYTNYYFIKNLSELKVKPFDYFVLNYVDFKTYDYVLIKKESDFYMCEYILENDKKCKNENVIVKNMYKMSKKYNDCLNNLDVYENEYYKVKILSCNSLENISNEELNKNINKNIFIFDEGTGTKLL